MFFDTTTISSTNQNNNTSVNQIFNPDNNTSFSIAIGGDSSGSDFGKTSADSTDFGNFTPTNENTTKQEASNDLGASVGFLGGTAGGVGMSETAQEVQDLQSLSSLSNNNFFEQNKNLIIIIAGIAFVALSSLFLIKKKRK